MPPRRRPQIERSHAIRSALELIDADGLAAFSVEKLGRHLNVRGPSLYHHFADRADLLARVAQLILLEVREPWNDDGEAPDWKDGLVRMGLELRRAILRHPNAGPLMLEHFPRRFVLETYEHTAAALEEAGIPHEAQLAIFEGVEKLTLGSALYEAAARTDPGTAFPAFDRDAFPALSRVVDSAPQDDAEALYVVACRGMLDGIEQTIIAQR